MTPLLLHIETAGQVCSVALSQGENLLELAETDEPQVHAGVITVLIADVLTRNGLKVKDLDAVGVSAGPGSYTGLRIGVSTAKGLCFGAEKPLIAVPTLQGMAQQFLNTGFAQYSPVCSRQIVLRPLIDARRMEVYTAAYSPAMQLLSPAKVVILTQENELSEELEHSTLLIFGSGAIKTADHFKGNQHLIFDPNFKNSAAGLLAEGYRRYKASQFEELAYFEPFYLKEFASASSFGKQAKRDPI